MSILLGYLWIPILFLLPFQVPGWVGIPLQLPMLLDGGTQALGWRTSNNFLRVLTGFLSGFGLSILAVWGARWLAEMVG
jgi:uncharacterized membrane protein